MKKVAVVLATLLGAVSRLFAYNPPVGGESIFRIGNPDLLAGAGTASGGPVFTVVPASIAFNPALTAFEQRVVLNVTYVGMLDLKSDEGDKYGQAFQLGLIIPTKWFVFTGFTQGSFSKIYRSYWTNSMNFKFGISKDVTEKLSLGANIYSGFYFGENKSDFTIGLDLGVLYRFDDIAFMKSPRLGISFLNLGKPLGSDFHDVIGANDTTDDVSFPGIITPHGSFAFTFLKMRNLEAGFSFGLTFPFFQNMLVDTAVALCYKNMVQFSITWDANVYELAYDKKANIPAVGLGIRFAINSRRISKNADWEQSELRPSFTWQNRNNGINIFSTGMNLALGLADTTPPEIILWNEE